MKFVKVQNHYVNVEFVMRVIPADFKTSHGCKLVLNDGNIVEDESRTPDQMVMTLDGRTPN